MSAPLLLTRATLRRDVPAAALRALLVPSGESARVGTGHRIVWTLFADRADRERDFLWRESEPGTFYLLSRREPEDRHALFEVEAPKAFAPVLAIGDRLRFSLRANATIARKEHGSTGRGKRADVVMNAIHGVPQGERAEARHDAVQTAGLAWLTAQGGRCGFTVVPSGHGLGQPTRVTTYRVLRVEHGGPDARLGVMDLDGELCVSDPARFIDSLGQGFGRAKAFGCGLMLIRRA